jgi:hypothetical protein
LISLHIPKLGPRVLLLALCAFAAAQNQPDALIISPPKVEFGNQSVASESAPVQITVRNGSNSAIHVDPIISSGIDFASSNNCRNELPAGAECIVEVKFKPAIAGDRMGAIAIDASDSGSPHFVPLAGTGK